MSDEENLPNKHFFYLLHHRIKLPLYSSDPTYTEHNRLQLWGSSKWSNRNLFQCGYFS